MSYPWTDVTFTGVYWNDPKRVTALLKQVRPWFTNVVVGVQTDNPENDATLKAARRWADDVVVDRVAGHCEPTIGKVLDRARTEWAFLVSADESPSESLLRSFQDIVDTAARGNHDGFWIRMISSIEGIDYPSEQDNHLRVFKRRLGWPPTLHSRPDARSALFWRPEDYLRHDRSLDEFCVDYLRYMTLSGTNSGWIAHNKQMMRDACTATARNYDWAKVKAYPWWAEVLNVAFDGVDPDTTT